MANIKDIVVVSNSNRFDLTIKWSHVRNTTRNKQTLKQNTIKTHLLTISNKEQINKQTNKQIEKFAKIGDQQRFKICGPFESNIIFLEAINCHLYVSIT